MRRAPHRQACRGAARSRDRSPAPWDRAERRRELGDLEILERGAKEIEEAMTADQPALQAEIHEAPDLAPNEARDPLLELVQLSRRVDRADQRADRRAADEIELDPALFQRADGADVRPTAGATRAERECNSRLANQSAREFTRAWRSTL